MSSSLFRGASYLLGDELETQEAQKLREEVRVPGAGMRWSALEDTYFLSMIAPKTPVSGVAAQPLLVTPGVGGRIAELPAAARRPSRSPTSSRIYPQEARLVARPAGERPRSGRLLGSQALRDPVPASVPAHSHHPLGHVRADRSADAPPPAVDPRQRGRQLRVGDRDPHLRHQARALPAHAQELRLDAEDAEAAAEDRGDQAEVPGQAARPEGPAQPREPAQDERGDAGAVQGRGRQPRRRLPAVAAADAGLLRVLRPAAQLGRALERALDRCGSTTCPRKTPGTSFPSSAASPSSFSRG